jgi:hypothetical protein
MSDHVALDRRLRFEIAGELWNACGEFIRPDKVLGLLGSTTSSMARATGWRSSSRNSSMLAFPAHKLDHVATLVLMTLNDRVNAELAALRRGSRA